ncbi:MAG: DUF4956 domain-containing protein [Prolixibacteraceae bacterium]
MHLNLLFVAPDHAFNEVAFFYAPHFLDLLIRFIFNFAVTLLIARYIYYRKTRRKDYLFTFLLINTMVFLLAYLLSDVELKLGFAFGLFALFGILRYRTNPVRIKEMTYLFVLIGIAVINSISDKYVPYSQVLLANFLVTVILWLLEFSFRLDHESSRKIVYETSAITPNATRNEKPGLFDKNNEKALIDELKEQTGIPIHRVDIVSINYVKKRAEIIIYFYDKDKIFNVTDDIYPERTN